MIETKIHELYDLSHDRSESHDLSKVYPDKVEELFDKWHNWAIHSMFCLIQKIVIIFAGLIGHRHNFSLPTVQLTEPHSKILVCFIY